jgi:hypothetical protein
VRRLAGIDGPHLTKSMRSKVPRDFGIKAGRRERSEGPTATCGKTPPAVGRFGRPRKSPIIVSRMKSALRGHERTRVACKELAAQNWGVGLPAEQTIVTYRRNARPPLAADGVRQRRGNAPTLTVRNGSFAGTACLGDRTRPNAVRILAPNVPRANETGVAWVWQRPRG